MAKPEGFMIQRNLTTGTYSMIPGSRESYGHVMVTWIAGTRRQAEIIRDAWNAGLGEWANNATEEQLKHWARERAKAHRVGLASTVGL